MKKIIIGLLALVLLSSLASAFGVSSVYYKDNPLTMNPGQNASIKLILQNGGASSSVSVKAVVEKGGDIVQITDPSDIYTIFPDQRVDVNINVRMPANATPGTIYNIRITFTTVDNNAGGFALGSSIGQNFDVETVQAAPPKSNPAKGYSWIIYLGIAILVLLILIIIVLLRRKSRKKSK